MNLKDMSMENVKREHEQLNKLLQKQVETDKLIRLGKVLQYIAENLNKYNKG